MSITKLKLIAILSLTTGLVFTAINLGFHYFGATATDNSQQRRDVKILYRTIQQFANNNTSLLLSTKYRLQKANGDWKETTTDYNSDGSIRGRYDTYAIAGKGVFAVSESQKTLFFRSPRPNLPSNFSEARYKSNPNYIGEATVAGFRTLVQRSVNKAVGGDIETTEFYDSPELGGLTLKIINKSADGATIYEATEAKIEPVTEAEFGSLPDYPVNYGSYKNQINSVEAAGQKQLADEMRRNIPSN